ncbi:ABC transporter substrate-binding protein [Pontivivens nitratireducens]|uniref:ABC transporter substrate-binding protein n=1 Tax=Pontivivens nitratireducens TaxID=2758038 RepID=UPI0016398D98|nr:ABC transporter substrate-binding protein [Pontibrevibacter nitratireducens]
MHVRPQAALHPRAVELAMQTRAGTLSRREFLATATALGVSGTAAYGLIGATPAAAQERPGRMGGILRVSMNVMPLDDPRLFDWPDKGNLTRQMLETLVRYDRDLTFRPMLLQRWEANADATVYMLHLRRDVRWSDGSPFDTRDVAHNIRRWCERRVPGNSMAARMGTLIDPTTDTLADGVMQIVDDHTIRLNLPRPDITLIPGMSDYPAMIVHRSFDGSTPLSEATIGTGPYLMTDLRPGRAAVFQKRPAGDYWGPEVYIDRIEVTDFGTDKTQEVAAFVAGDLDLNDQTQSEFVQQMDEAGFVRSRVDTAATIVARMNVNHPPYDNRTVRNALQLAVNNAVVLELGHHGYGMVAENHHVGPMHPEYAQLTPITSNPARARAMLVQAGHLDTTFELISTDGDWRTMTSDAIAAQLLDAGIKVKRTIISNSAFARNWTKYPFSTTDWIHRPLGVQNLALGYRTGEAWNETGYSDPAFDELLNAALAVPQADRRRLLMAEIERTLQASGVIIQPYWRSIFTHSTSRVRNYGAHPLMEMYLNETWLDEGP